MSCPALSKTTESAKIGLGTSRRSFAPDHAARSQHERNMITFMSFLNSAHARCATGVPRNGGHFRVSPAAARHKHFVTGAGSLRELPGLQPRERNPRNQESRSLQKVASRILQQRYPFHGVLAARSGIGRETLFHAGFSTTTDNRIFPSLQDPGARKAGRFHAEAPMGSMPRLEIRFPRKDGLPLRQTRSWFKPPGKRAIHWKSGHGERGRLLC
jgi:hypothetical protein